MDSLDAQCLVVDLASSEDAQPPDQWQDLADGTLAYRFGSSSNTFSWRKEVVGDLAERWRTSDKPVPAQIAGLVRTHQAFAAMVENGKVDPPDRVIHDLRTGELEAIWNDEKLLVIVEPDAA